MNKSSAKALDAAVSTLKKQAVAYRDAGPTTHTSTAALLAWARCEDDDFVEAFTIIDNLSNSLAEATLEFSVEIDEYRELYRNLDKKSSEFMKMATSKKACVSEHAQNVEDGQIAFESAKKSITKEALNHYINAQLTLSYKTVIIMEHMRKAVNQFDNDDAIHDPNIVVDCLEEIQSFVPPRLGQPLPGTKSYKMEMKENGGLLSTPGSSTRLNRDRRARRTSKNETKDKDEADKKAEDHQVVVPQGIPHGAVPPSSVDSLASSYPSATSPVPGSPVPGSPVPGQYPVGGAYPPQGYGTPPMPAYGSGYGLPPMTAAAPGYYGAPPPGAPGYGYGYPPAGQPFAPQQYGSGQFPQYQMQPPPAGSPQQPALAGSTPEQQTQSKPTS